MIIFIGFKHVGKSTLGRAYADHMELPFVDLDDVLILQHQMTPREIVKTHGEEAFRQLERQALLNVIEGNGVLAVGGGTPMQNADLLKGHTCIHLTADPDQVFDWITENGYPPFFSKEDPRQSFDELWEARRPHYEELATHQVHNHNDYDKLIQEINDLIS